MAEQELPAFFAHVPRGPRSNRAAALPVPPNAADAARDVGPAPQQDGARKRGRPRKAAPARLPADESDLTVYMQAAAPQAKYSDWLGKRKMFPVDSLGKDLLSRIKAWLASENTFRGLDHDNIRSKVRYEPSNTNNPCMHENCRACQSPYHCQ